MSVLIKGMEMPKRQILAVINPNGLVEVLAGNTLIAEFEAVPVPPHGALMGRAELWVEINKICDRRDAGIITDLTCLQQILSAVRHAPTIIPAEEGE